MENAWNHDFVPSVNDTHTADDFSEYVLQDENLAQTKKEARQLIRLRPQLNANQTQEIPRAVVQISKLTKQLKKTPFDAAIWVERGQLLLRLRYPELSIGDFYKAWLLLKRRHSPEYPSFYEVHRAISRHISKTRKDNAEVGAEDLRHEEFAEQLESTVFELFCGGLFFANSFQECIDTIEYGVQRYGDRMDFDNILKLATAARKSEIEYHEMQGVSEEEISQKLAYGSINARAYPFAHGTCYSRMKFTVEDLKSQLQDRSNLSCTIKRTGPFVQGVGANYGVFAVRDIPKDTKLFDEPASLAAISGTLKGRCLACYGSLAEGKKMARETDPFCSFACRSRYHHHFGDYDTDCGILLRNEDTIPIGKKTTDSADASAQSRMLMRTLAYAVSQFEYNGVHPLYTPLLNGICAAYPANSPVDFSFKRDIQEPLKALENMGIDIFKEHDFDTWVLQTIMAKLRTNIWEVNDEDDTHWEGVQPLYSLFNHSCEPNVAWEKKDGVAVIELRTKRAVKAGEQLCISYLHDEDLELRRKERAEKLSGWFQKCACAACRPRTNRKRMRLEDDSWMKLIDRMGKRARKH